MSLFYAQVLFLLLHVNLVVTQEGQYVEQVQEDGRAEGQYVEQVQEEGGDEAAGQLLAGCEEGLEYMRFLRKDISEKIENTLQKTLFQARESKEENVLKVTVDTVLVQVMEVRETILERIKQIRRGEAVTCVKGRIHQDKRLEEMRMQVEDVLLKLVKKQAASISGLKQISLALLGWKKSVGDEVMRVMMLPEVNVKEKFEILAECEECRKIEEISFRVENLLTCVEREEEIFTEENFANIFGRFGGEFDNTANEEEKLIPGDFCESPDKYATEVLVVIDIVDAELKLTYNKLITNKDGGKRKKYQDNLSFYSSTRNTLENVMQELMEEAEDEKEKTIVKDGLTGLSNELVDVLKECMLKCGSIVCDSCAVEMIKNVMSKLDNYNQQYTDKENLEPARLAQRKDLIELIEENNANVRDIIKEKTRGSSVSKCDEDKKDVWAKLKNPLWMLVNTTIHGEVEMIVIANKAMNDLLEELLQDHCSPDDRTENLKLDLNCGMGEYEHTKEVIDKIGDIQQVLFKENSERAKLEAILGFVNIMKILDNRVKKLFEEVAVVTCPNEIKLIKSDYMPKVTMCMAKFMNTKLKFSQISRMERMSCIKQLGTSLENRKLSLLKAEVDRSLNLIDRPTAAPLSVY